MDKKNKDEWIRFPSRGHPGRFYLFNMATGERKWEPLKTDAEEKQKKQESPPIPPVKVSKTPAQDRLKRLQHSLKLCQTKSNTSNTKTKKLKEQTKELTDEPTTSVSARAIVKSPKKANKRIFSEISPSEKVDSVKSAKYHKGDYPKTLPIPDSSAHSCTKSVPVKVDICGQETGASNELVNNENLQNMETKTSTFTSIRSSIAKKIKEIWKVPFNISKKVAEEANDNSFGIINTTKLKTANKSKSKHNKSTLETQEAIVKLIREENKKSPESKILTCSREQVASKNLNIPSYPRGSANSRLERLKQSLVLQQQSCSTKDPVTSIAIETNNNQTSLHQKDFKPDSNESDNVPDNRDVNSISDEIEAMDWQPIMKDEYQSDATVVIEKSEKCSLKDASGDENQTMGDIIDRVNENLLRVSAEKQKGSIANNNKWRKDFYYFIVDTNVLLKDLTFIEDLSKMKLCDTKGSMLYIPYAVLQELDKLKMCSGSKEGVKTLAVRAIKYLNSKLTNNSSHVQAQSAVEERHHLVDVNSADDGIINCCLQAKEHIPNLVFLTEDVNLMNKAISNEITVSTRSDLVSKRYDSSDDS